VVGQKAKLVDLENSLLLIFWKMAMGGTEVFPSISEFEI
jgi:hypothetical protein